MLFKAIVGKAKVKITFCYRHMILAKNLSL